MVVSHAAAKRQLCREGLVGHRQEWTAGWHGVVQQWLLQVRIRALAIQASTCVHATQLYMERHIDRGSVHNAEVKVHPLAAVHSPETLPRHVQCLMARLTGI